jgi:hypothetical protein
MWKNILESDRPQMTIWSIRVACWVPAATKTPSDCVTLIALPRQQWLHECASTIHLYVDWLSRKCGTHEVAFLLFTRARH